MRRSHPLATRARPPGPPGAQAGLGSGSLKSVVRACFLLPQSRAPLLFSSAPAVLPPSSPRHDKTQPSLARTASSSINDHLAATQPLNPPTSSSTDAGARHPTLSAKKHTSGPRLDRNPSKAQSQTQHDYRWSDPTAQPSSPGPALDPTSHTHATYLSIISGDLRYSVDTRPRRRLNRRQ